MDLQILSEFTALSKTCNFQETAADYNMSQANLSKHIRKLEEELGVQLFDRTGRTVRLNQYGALYADYAQQMVQLQNEALHKLSQLQDEGGNSLHIGFHPVLGQYGIVNLLAQFNEQYPDIQTHITESVQAEEMLKSFRCELFFAPDDELANPAMHHVPFSHDRLTLVCLAGHPLARESCVTFEQLRDEKFIAHSVNSHPCSNNYVKMCGEIGGFTPNIVTTVSRTATIVRLVSEGQGIALLFRRYVPTDIPNVVTVDIFPEISIHTSVFYCKQRPLSTAAKKLLDCMRSRR